ncbi:hypothetical protein [uncultured Sphingomonas sp.]|uniref:hypothetical protein n=1 Tax=uncultured Sphingomonas sp. TaxID=158754 RepID=UPI0025EA79B5|nr:hypothetical protein [uncultured Sphingomonas sp.]
MAPASTAPLATAAAPAPAAKPDPIPVERPVRRKRDNRPWLLLLLVVLVLGLGVGAATILWGPQQVASRLGIAEQRVPLGIAITREPDWRMIAGGSQLFAVSGRIWNPTDVEQAVPDIRAELKDGKGKTVYAWTITRPVARLGPGQQIGFDGAAVDVPDSSSNISVSFAGTDEKADR